MIRREFITLLGGAVAAWPLAARAQQRERMRRIGVLIGTAADDAIGQARIGRVPAGLGAVGLDRSAATCGSIFAGRQPMPTMLAVTQLSWWRSRRTSSWPRAASVRGAVTAATRTIPIVFAEASDPVGAGFVESLGAARWQCHRLYSRSNTA